MSDTRWPLLALIAFLAAMFYWAFISLPSPPAWWFMP